MAVTVPIVAFGGLNTDLPPEKLPSGTADIALNVTTTAGRLQKRAGFGQWEDSVDKGGTPAGIKSMAVARFSNGTTYVVCKLSDGYQWQRATTATDFAKITGGWTADGNDPGWFYMWGDFLHYFCRAGGYIWNPGYATVYKAGLPAPTTALTALATTGGDKAGTYRIRCAYRNSVTEAEGISSAGSSLITCTLAANNAIVTTNWSTVKAADSDYLWDQLVVYCSNGTEATVNESFSVYREAIIPIARVAEIGLGLPDRVHDARFLNTHAGGVPPASRIGCLAENSQAIYGLTYSGSTVLGDRIAISLAGCPVMVPQENIEGIRLHSPYPWNGIIRTGLAGNPTAMAYGGGAAVMFTPTSTQVLTQVGDGRRAVRVAHPGKGCAVEMGATGTPGGVYALGYHCMLRVTAGTVTDLAEKRFTTTLAEIPAAYQSVGCSGFYSYRNQVWFAVVKAGGTVAQRILVYDLSEDKLMAFDPASLVAGEGITAMCELNYSGVDPTMLVGTSTGRILQYPVGVGDVVLAGTTTHYAANGRFYVAQERAAMDQRLTALHISCGDNVANNVTVGVRPMNVGGETRTQAAALLTKSNKMESPIEFLTQTNGRFFQIEFSSTAACTTQWTINNLALSLDRIDNRTLGDPAALNAG